MSRRVDEAVLIGDDIRLIVLSTDGETVKLGIEAPSDVALLREEIVVGIATENRRARASESARKWVGPLREVEAESLDRPQPPSAGS